MIPIGKQCASGLSLLLSACRCFTSSAAHGRIGRPPSTPVPMSRNKFIPVLGAGAAVPAAGGAPPVPDAVTNAAAAPRGFCQIPERSGLPSGVLGAGALTSGCPLAVFAIRGVGYAAHCADSDVDVAAIIAVRHRALTNLFISGLPTCGWNLLESG